MSFEATSTEACDTPPVIMEEKPINSPPSGRRVMSGSDAGVTYHADEHAQLVPPPTSRSDSSHQRESKASGRRRSNFSQQISATRYGTSHLYQRANRAEEDAARDRIDPSRLPILEPKVYTPARSAHKPSTSKDKGKRVVQQHIGGSPAPSVETPPARRRPPPLITSKPLHPKRSLSNFKTKGEEFTRSVREKLGFHSASSHSGDISARFDGNGESTLVAPDKALRVLGAKGDLTATTRARDEGHPSVLSSLFRTPLHSASDTSRTSTTSTRKSEDTSEEHALVGGQFGQHLRYLNGDTPPTPPTQKKPPVPPKDNDSSLPARFENNTSPTRSGKPQAKSVPGYRDRPDVDVSDVKSMYGAYVTSEEDMLTRRSPERENGSGRLKPIPEYTPSMYSSISMRPSPLHIPESSANGQQNSETPELTTSGISPERPSTAEENHRDASDGSVSVPLYYDLPSESEANSRRTSIINVATYIHDLGAQFQFSIISSIVSDLRSHSQDAADVDILTRLKARLEAIGTLPEIGRLDSIDGLEQTIVHLQERLAAMKSDPMTTSQVSVLRPMWDERPAGYSPDRVEETAPSQEVDDVEDHHQNVRDTPPSPNTEPPATVIIPSAPIAIPIPKQLPAVDRLRNDTPDVTTRPNSQDSSGFVGVFTMTGVTTPLGSSPLRLSANNNNSPGTLPFTNSEFNLAIRQITAGHGPGPSISPGEASASSYDTDYVDGHDIAQPQALRERGGGGGAQGYFERAGRRSPQHQWAVAQARVALSQERREPSEVHPAHRKGE